MGWQEDRKNINHAKALAACRASGLIKVKDVYDPPTPWLWWGWHRGHVRIKIDFPGYFQLEFGSAEDPSALENILCSPGPQVETACWLQACSSHFSHREDVWEAVSLPFVTQGKGVYGSFTVKHFQYIPARSALWEEEEDVIIAWTMPYVVDHSMFTWRRASGASSCLAQGPLRELSCLPFSRWCTHQTSRTTLAFLRNCRMSHWLYQIRLWGGI